uniref:Uncharacterized protein n=1 Tax=Timema bartmani TaxID=61472 RepID=A0A7R9EXP6_9NEOP|nr:unnamed protein product [Timema bartmani]
MLSQTTEDGEIEVRISPEEQQVDETYEQFEERVLNKRAGHMYHIVKSKLNRSDKLFLSEMVHRNNRKQVTWWSRGKVSDFCAGGPEFNPRSRHSLHISTTEDREIEVQISVRSSSEEEGSCCLRMSAKSQFIWDQGIVLKGSGLGSEGWLETRAGEMLSDGWEAKIAGKGRYLRKRETEAAGKMRDLSVFKGIEIQNE